MQTYKRLLTIAGSDSSGGAGIQADLKTFSACGCFGMSAITAVTAQNTQGVLAIHSIPTDVLQSQIRAVVDDIGVDAVKIGMLHSAEVVKAVALVLKEYQLKNIVLDPVMVATSGDPLIEKNAITAMQDELFPMVRLITPNIPETELLLGDKLDSENILEAALTLSDKYSTSVLVKAGHLADKEVVDVLYNNETKQLHSFTSERLTTRNSHGTGCTLSSAIASFLAHRHTLPEAVGKGLDYVHDSLAAGSKYKLGQGHGPVHHFHNFWK